MNKIQTPIHRRVVYPTRNIRVHTLMCFKYVVRYLHSIRYVHLKGLFPVNFQIQICIKSSSLSYGILYIFITVIINSERDKVLSTYNL